MAKFIFVIGGVISGVGKGVATSSIGAILQSRGFSVTAIKIDPYLNIDAGTLNPTEHGEVFVTKDGIECDQDIGNYERFMNIELSRLNYMTTGMVYSAVIEKERNLEYDGKTVEVFHHIPMEVIDRIERVADESKSDFVLVEVGGTVGEYQNILFLEAARLMSLRNKGDVLFILVSYLLQPKMIGEMKTKPTQYAVRTLNSVGIQPDIIIARGEKAPDDIRKEKIALSCSVDKDAIISAVDVQKSIYEVPLRFEKEGIVSVILRHFDIEDKKSDLKQWRYIMEKVENGKQKVKIGIVGKYFESGKFVLADSYISVIEAIKHATWSLDLSPDIEWLSAEEYEKNPDKLKEIKDYDGIIVPGGFGSRGIEGKIAVAQYCRENKVPYLGLCYGLHMAVIEIARNVCGLKGANTIEIDENTKYPVVSVMEEQKAKIMNKEYGGSMRLGNYECAIQKDTIAANAYKESKVLERHRHRYEVNNQFIDKLEEAGCVFSGVNPDTRLVEIMEYKDHPFFLGTQFHPEFKSRPMSPHPLFVEFIKAGAK